MLSGLMYAVRWAEYSFLFLIATDLSLNKKTAWRLVMAMTWTGLALAILGFIQLKLFPDFTFMVPRGWDPHVGRMLSTWFDPNFLGGYLAALTTISFAIALSRGRRGYWWWAATAIMALAVALTYSRSGYLALAAGLGIVALVKSRLMLWLGLLAVIAAVLFVPRIQERVIGIRTVDETAQMRLVSWSNALTVVGDHPVIGVGYNFYRYVQVQYGFLNKTSAHSASGSDSSLLTVAVTTGLIGLAVYIWLYLAFLREAVLLAKSTAAGKDWVAYGLGLTAALVALLIHGQFVNGLLYPHIMQFIWISLGIAVAIKQDQR
jgi:O-antigen ligase